MTSSAFTLTTLTLQPPKPTRVQVNPEAVAVAADFPAAHSPVPTVREFLSTSADSISPTCSKAGAGVNAAPGAAARAGFATSFPACLADAAARGSGVIEQPGVCPQCHGKGTIEQTANRMKFNVTCPRCGGTGKNVSPCPVCHGEGVVSRTEPLEVRIKAGTRDGQRIRIPGKGNAGGHGGPAGDLYVIIRTGEHPLFRRDGDDIYLTVPVSGTEAAVGAKIEVPTIDGRAVLKIPPGTQPGQKLRLREKGVPSATKDGERRDEIVEITVTVPMPRDERTKELLRELAKLNPEDPREELWNNV